MNTYITIPVYNDGFGSQYQKIIECYIFSKFNNLIFHYRPFSSIEHNYDNDSLFIKKKEKFINLIDNIENINFEQYKYTIVTHETFMYNFFEKNIDICCNSEHMKFIKNCFWKNKDKNVFKNENMNIVIHIRRLNAHDGGITNAGDRITNNNNYYLNIINTIKKKHSNKKVLFHIHSQGKLENFFEFSNQENIILKLNDDSECSFIEMVAADILVISPSSFSYTAALLSDGEVWYKPFWHRPLKKWIIS
jgi:hypothetical protein